MNKICTSLEQSQKLIEMGIDINTADMLWTYDFTVNDINGLNVISEQLKPEENDIPAWSLTTLMNLLPSEFTEVGKYSTTTYKIHIRKYKFTDKVDLYQIAYGNYKIYEDGSSSWKDMINTGEKENLIDAVFQMICWLKENKKI